MSPPASPPKRAFWRSCRVGQHPGPWGIDSPNAPTSSQPSAPWRRLLRGPATVATACIEKADGQAWGPRAAEDCRLALPSLCFCCALLPRSPGRASPCAPCILPLCSPAHAQLPYHLSYAPEHYPEPYAPLPSMTRPSGPTAADRLNPLPHPLTNILPMTHPRSQLHCLPVPSLSNPRHVSRSP